MLDVFGDPILWGTFGEGQDRAYDSLDDREALERQIGVPGHDPAATLARWREATADAVTDEQFSNQAYPLGVNRWQPIEGTSWQRWGRWLEVRLSEAAEHPETRLDPAVLPERYTWRRRRGTPLAQSTAARLTEEASDARRPVLDEWAASPFARGRHCYFLHDTGVAIGRVDELAPADDCRDQIVVESRTSTTIGVRVVRTLEEGWTVSGLHVALPSTPEEVEVRRRWPSLAAALGGYFSDDERLSPWSVQRTMLFTEDPEFLDDLACEGADLLRLSDDELLTAVRALGCYAEPPHLRLWLTWMFWRIRTFDWNWDDLAR